MKRFLLLGACALQLAAFSQNVGVGTNNPLNKLHVAGGFRLDTLVGVGGNGVLIHNSAGAVYGLKFTGDVNDVLRGDGTFGASGSGGSNDAFWSLTGNAGTDPAINFIGTTDNKPFLFRVNNELAGQINPLTLNTTFGMRILNSNTTGHDNTVVGFQSLRSNTTGNYNVSMGDNSLYFNTTGNQNTALGYATLTANTSGYNNTAIGFQSLRFNTTGYLNTANGVSALFSNTSGDHNTAEGMESLYSNTTGSDNEANGYRALYSNTTGYYNTANGYDALYFNTTGSANTANGEGALSLNTTGGANTAEGFEALHNTGTSLYNTAVGYSAGSNHDNGYNNVFVGANTGTNGDGYYNDIAIGQGTTCTTSSQVIIGNPSTLYYRTYGAWLIISDGRYKKNIKEDVAGLAFINKLRPVTYNLDATGLDNILHKNVSADKQLTEWGKEIGDKALKEKEQIRYTGFVAQEVEKSAKELGFDFSGVNAPKNENDVYSLGYAEFVVPLVKAVQEQQKIIENQQQQIDDLRKELQSIKEKLKR
jgi:hypothetical protein